MKRKILLTLTFALMIVLIGCSLLSSPAKEVLSFFKLIEKGEISKAYDLLSQGLKQRLSMAGGAQRLGKLTNEIKGKGGIRDIKIIKEEITGELATVIYEITFENGSIEKDNENLIKEEGKWKITE